jgi:hypothetical protein
VTIEPAHVFLVACAIFVVTCIGVVVSIFNQRKLRKLEKEQHFTSELARVATIEESRRLPPKEDKLDDPGKDTGN